ncbi:response regulator [Chromobacterium violaceum]|uniref:response regulator n=1 Tax=Chromobacterium violaceum TaxID=536 RepID=UPI003DA8A56B
MTILLIEDDAELGAGLRQFLQQQGYDCLWLRDGGEVAAHWRQAELAILDRQLPDGDSLRLLPQWLALKALPVIVLTARVELDDRVAGLEAGARDYLTKPFAHVELLARVRAQLRPLGEGALACGELQCFRPGWRRPGAAARWRSPAPSSTCWRRWRGCRAGCSLATSC